MQDCRFSLHLHLAVTIVISGAAGICCGCSPSVGTKGIADELQ